MEGSMKVRMVIAALAAVFAVAAPAHAFL